MEEREGAVLHTRVKEAGGIPVVELEGEIDLSTSPLFKERVYEVIDAGGKEIVIDLNGLSFMDSTGLGVLVAVLKKTKSEGGRVRLVCGRENIRKVFILTGLDKVFSIYDNLQRCLEDRLKDEEESGG